MYIIFSRGPWAWEIICVEWNDFCLNVYNQVGQKVWMLFLQRCSWLNLINFSRKDSHWKWFICASADSEAWSLSAYLRSSLSHSAFIVQKLYNSNWRASWVLSFMKMWAVFCFYNIPEIITDVALGAGGAAVAALFPKWITSQQVSSVKSENDVIFCLKTSEITSLYWTCFLEYEDDPDRR